MKAYGGGKYTNVPGFHSLEEPWGKYSDAWRLEVSFVLRCNL